MVFRASENYRNSLQEIWVAGAIIISRTPTVGVYQDGGTHPCLQEGHLIQEIQDFGVREVPLHTTDSTGKNIVTAILLSVLYCF